MKSYELIRQLVSLVEEQEAHKPGKELTLEDFTGFLLNKLEGGEVRGGSAEVRFGENDRAALDIAFQLDNNISRLFVFMSRYAKFYIKKALEGTPLQTPEDFTALAILLTHDRLSKSQLISHNLQEKTSGTEVIRRLIAAGLVKEWADTQDKRSKHIAITPEGKALLFEVFEHTNYVGRIITGKLSLSEKFNLQYLLQELEDFHLEHYEKKTIGRKSDLKDLAEGIKL